MVARLGQTSDVQVVNTRYRILQGQALILQYVSSVSPTLRAWARVRYDNGEDDVLFIPDAVAVTDPIIITNLASDVARMDGWVTDALVQVLQPHIQRGSVYVRLFLDPFGPVLCSDYCHSTFGQVALGTYIQPGPGGGMGDLKVVTVKAVGAPAATTTYRLNADQIIRKISQIVHYYECSVDVASRILDVKLTDPLGIAPAGMSGATNQIWSSLSLTLTASQDGVIFADEFRSGDNDNGTITIEDGATNPSPFPLWSNEDMDPSYALVFTVTAGEVLDEDAIYSLVEEWVVL